MPEINQYSFTYDELITAMIRSAGIESGRWTLVVNFSFSAANIGMGGGAGVPSAIIGVQGCALQRADENTPPNLIVDAAELAGK